MGKGIWILFMGILGMALGFPMALWVARWYREHKTDNSLTMEDKKRLFKFILTSFIAIFFAVLLSMVVDKFIL